MSGIRPGDVIAGKFRIERVLGEGGMGYVVAARHLQLGQMVALKFMRAEVCTPEYKARFLREARNTVRLKSKHVSRVLDVGSLDGASGAPYMVMEYLEGTDLSDLLHKRGALPVADACDYIIQACEAITEAHGHGIVHRDLKPANLFLTRGSGGEPVVKVLDFGVSKVLELGMDDTSPGGRPRSFHNDSVVTRATDMLGSPSYMAPEQIASARDADARSDVWSLGVILFRLVSGKAPFTASSLGELIQSIMHGPIPNLRDARPDVPPGLEHVVGRCLERERSRRLPDVVELARMLAPYAGPVATPSLERIAILGPALVTASPASAPSGHSYVTGGNAWAGPPMAPSVTQATKKPVSSAGMVVWGALFAAVVASLVIMAARIVGKPLGLRAAPPMTSNAVAPVVDPGATAVPATPTSTATDPVGTSLPASAPPSAAPVRPTAPTAPTHPGGAVHVSPPKRPDHKGPATTPGTTAGAPSAGTGEIPATRE